MYANITADKLLEEGRTVLSKEIQIEKYQAFEEEIIKDAPAVFVYSPDFIYIIPKNIKGLTLGVITTPGERFLNVYEWHIETDRVWNIFAKKTI